MLRHFNKLIRLITSMRFAIAMLLIIAISSVIGTILKQAEPYTNYVNRFGDFWTTIFITLDLHQIYSSWWFLIILSFLVISTCLCIIRTWPRFYKQFKNYKINIRKEFLTKQKLNFIFEKNPSKPLLNNSLKIYSAYLTKKSFRYKTNIYSTENKAETESDYLIAAKSGKANKWGYLFTHIGIIVICVGGLIDGNLPLKFLQIQGKIKPFKGENIIPQNAILNSDNPSFRANLFVPEGESANLAIINTTDGILGQKLPFNVELKRFFVDYYETGMPKRFVSDIKIHDIKNNKVIATSLEVNKPFTYNGYNLFQASFEDGGSSLELKPNILDLSVKNNINQSLNQNSNIKINMGQSQKININNQEYTLEITDFRAINVHNLQDNNQDEQDKNLKNNLKNKLSNLHGSSSQIKDKKFKNVGPTIEYTLRDSAGQAIAYHSYMLPILINNKPTYLIGMRTDNTTPFQYLHIPIRSSNIYNISGIDEWLSIYHAVKQQNLRSQAALRYAKLYPEKLRDSLFASSYKALNIFADGGLSALSEFIQKTVPANEQAKASEVILRMLQGSLWELWDLNQELTSHKSLDKTQENQEYLQRALIAISDSSLLKTNVWFSLANFNEKKASVIQVTKSPGQNIVYLGCLLLVVGVFLMMFIQEKRLWLLKQNNTIIIAIQFQRQNIHTKQQFTEICDEIKKL